MPIIHVKSLPPSTEVDVEQVLKELCMAVSKAMDISKVHVWGTWDVLEPGLYIEGDTSKFEQPTHTHPPLVQFTLLEGRDPRIIENTLHEISRVLSELLGIQKDNVFITLHPVTREMVYNHGQILSRNPNSRDEM